MTPPRPALSRMFAMVALVAFGSAVGTVARAVIESAVITRPGQWPWATFGINIIGSFLLGGLLEAIARRGDDTGWRRVLRLGIGTGVLGGFTTYSTFIIEITGIAREGNLAAACAYAVVSVAAGVAAAGAGVLVIARLFSGTGEHRQM